VTSVFKIRNNSQFLRNF